VFVSSADLVSLSLCYSLAETRSDIMAAYDSPSFWIVFHILYKGKNEQLIKHFEQGHNGDKITIRCALCVQLLSGFCFVFLFVFKGSQGVCEHVGFSAGIGRLSHWTRQIHVLLMFFAAEVTFMRANSVVWYRINWQILFVN